MSAPGSAYPTATPSSKPQTKVTITAIALTLLGAAAYFIPVRTFESQFLWGGRPVLLNSQQSGAGMFEIGLLGTTDLTDAAPGFQPWFLVVFLVLMVAATVMLARRSAPRIAGALITAAGILSVAVAGIHVSANAKSMVSIPASVTETTKFIDRAVAYGTVTTPGGAYFVFAIALVVTGFGIFALVRRIGPKAGGPASAPSPHQSHPYAPGHPYTPGHQGYGPVVSPHQPPYPVQPPAGYPPHQPGQPMPPQRGN